MKLADELRTTSIKNNVDEIEVERYYNYIVDCAKSTANRGVATSVAFKTIIFTNTSLANIILKVINKLIDDGFYCYFKKLHNKDNIEGTYFIVSWENENKH